MALIDNAIRLGEWKRKDQWEYYASLFHCAVVPMNDTALSLLKDAHEEMKRSKRYRHQIKHLMKSAKSAGEEYERLLHLELELNRYGDRKMYLMDYMDAWQDILKHDIDIFRFSISQYLLKLGYDKENSLMTSVYLAYIMVDYACSLWDAYWNMVKNETGMDLSKTYTNARLTHVLNYLEPVAMSFDPHGTVDFDNDPNCRLALDIIQKNATSADSINKAGKQALDYNEDVRQWANDYDKIKQEDKRKFLDAI